MQRPKTWSKTTEPASYDQIYRFLHQALSECSAYIDEIENDYYQDTSTALNTKPKAQSARKPLSVNTLISWSSPLNELRNARLLSDVRNGKTIRDLLNEARTGNFGENISDESVNLMKRVLDKTNEQLHSKMPNLANKIGESMNLMEQYFLSFYDIENIQEVVQKRKNDKPPVSILVKQIHCCFRSIFALKTTKVPLITHTIHTWDECEVLYYSHLFEAPTII